MPVNVLLLGGMAALGKEMIEAQLHCDARVTVVADAATAHAHEEAFARADVIVAWPLNPVIATMGKNVKLVQAAGAGVDGLAFDQLPPGAVVANTFHHEISIAEHIVMAMLVLTRRPMEYDRRLRTGDWTGSCIWGRMPSLDVLYGKSALLIGTGHIAREVARRASPFGVKTVAVSRTPGARAPQFDRIVGYDTWLDVLPDIDFVIPCCPLAPETEGLIGAQVFARMRPSSFLINAARGKIIEEQALYEALRDGRIAGAAIDVWYQYPHQLEERCYPSKYPFHELPNVLMTPHLSGWTHLTIEGRMRDIAQNINRLAHGLPLLNVVYP